MPTNRFTKYKINNTRERWKKTDPKSDTLLFFKLYSGKLSPSFAVFSLILMAQRSESVCARHVCQNVYFGLNRIHVIFTRIAHLSYTLLESL